MTFFRLIIQSILHYRRQHLALLAGILLSTAILTGALITGDSVKHSLRKMVDLRLGNTGFALETGDRYVSTKLATELAASLNTKTAAVLRNTGIAINPSSALRINQTEILGIDEAFCRLSDLHLETPQNGEAIISKNLAEKLQLQEGDTFIIRMKQAEIIPANAPFARENTSSKSLRLKVISIAGTDDLGRFSLQSNQVAPYNIFVSRKFLSGQLDLENLANLILIENQAGLNAAEINDAFGQSWNLQDAGLEVKSISGTKTYELTSNRIFIDPVVADAVESLKTPSIPALTYLVNEVKLNDKSTPYSFVSATDPPVIPELPGANEITINSWLADDLNAEVEDTLLLKYFIIGPLRKLEESQKQFVVKAILPLNGSEEMRSLMPDFPGMANAGSCSDWEAGVPVDLKAIRDKDEKYWDEYRGTPKAFISLETGKSIWRNPFGSYTAFRFSSAELTSETLKQQIKSRLSPMDFGLQFRPVRSDGLNAVTNAVDFGELFLSLSFFVIAAGILLTALLFSLHVTARNHEGAILSALGFSQKQIIRFRILEALLVIVVGAIAGAFAGILYNIGIMRGLNSVWQDVVRETMLWVHVKPTTLVIGAMSGAFIALTAIWIIVRRKSKLSVRQAFSEAPVSIKKYTPAKLLPNAFLIYLCIPATILLVAYSMSNHNGQNPGLFLTAGGIFMAGCLAIIYRILKKQNQKFHPDLTTAKLVFRNISKYPGSNLSTITLLALGTFTIVITGANQQTFYGASNKNESGTGGFTFWAETSVPLIYDLNTNEGKVRYGLEDEAILDSVNFVQFLNRRGDDASCLNLNQVSQPQVLGINPVMFDQKESFSFAGKLSWVDDDHPWLSLRQKNKKSVIPAVADQTVITWGLMEKVGDTLTFLNEQGQEIELLLIAGLKNSIFQGNILIDEHIFRQNFPSAGGSQIMLIDAPDRNKDAVAALLETRLTDLGITITPTTTRLATFNSVTNTYLSVFMILGGLGVLIGTIGLGIVLMRNLLERKSELAVMSALGFRKSMILKIIFLENIFLLASGIFVGLCAAVIGILPSIHSPAFTMNTGLVTLLITAITFSGLTWVYFPARQSLKNISVRALQSE